MHEVTLAKPCRRHAARYVQQNPPNGPPSLRLPEQRTCPAERCVAFWDALVALNRPVSSYEQNLALEFLGSIFFVYVISLVGSDCSTSVGADCWMAVLAS